MEYTYIEKGTVKDNVLNLPQLTLEVTNACNLKCKYCGYGELYCGYDSRNNEMLSEEKVFRLLEYLHKGWSMSNSFHKKTYISFYGGEPLLNMALIKKVVKWIQDHPLPQCDFVFTMTTNGLLLSQYLDYLVEFDFKLLVSLDGDCSNNAYRVDFGEKSSFERVFENVKLAQQKYPDFFEKNISFNSVLHNLNNYQDIVRFFREEFEKMPSRSEL
ncbi:MAG: radical SAM protein, partial [Tannerellaceae bacterium]